MRAALFVAVLAVACGGGSKQGSTFASEYVARGDQAAAGRQWGDAMAAYDAAYNENPESEDIKTRRQEAAAHWVEETAPTLARESPPEKAFALLDALAREGNARGATAAVEAHVTPALDALVADLWQVNPNANDVKSLWTTIQQGEAFVASLPRSSKSRALLEDLRERAVDTLVALAQKSQHGGAMYIYAAMEASLRGGAVDGGATNSLAAITERDYELHISTPGGCPELEAAFRKKLADTKDYFGERAHGMKARVDVQVSCVALEKPKQRKESRSWVETNFTNTVSCSTNVVQAETARQIVGYSRMTGQQVIISIEPVYKNVETCSSSFGSQKQTVTDEITITVEERGYHARGIGAIAIGGKAYVLPVSARSVWEKITTEGALFGKAELQLVDQPTLLIMAANTLWMEMAQLEEKALEGYVDDLLKQAATKTGEDKLGTMVAATRITHRVKPEHAAFFAETLGLDKQQVAELVLGAAHVAPTIAATEYKLDVPKVDRKLERQVERKKAAAGVDDFK